MLHHFSHSRRFLYPLLALLVWSGLAFQQASADIITTEVLLAEMSHTSTQQQLAAALDRSDVVQQLEQYGVSAADAADRIAALTDAEAQQLAQHFDELPAGGNVTILLVVIILILLLR